MAKGFPALVREDESSTDTVEITHYLRIYGELLSFQRHLLERARAGSDRASELDVTELEVEVEQLERRLEFWEDRLAESRSIVVDEDRRILQHRGVGVPLTRREMQLLQCLLRNPDTFLTSKMLIEGAWAGEHLAEEQVRTYVVRLRRKMAQAGVACRIVSVPRQGYTLEFDKAAG
jgi:DNA-binding response OmpR family regulator